MANFWWIARTNKIRWRPFLGTGWWWWRVWRSLFLLLTWWGSGMTTLMEYLNHWKGEKHSPMKREVNVEMSWNVYFKLLGTVLVNFSWDVASKQHFTRNCLTPSIVWINPNIIFTDDDDEWNGLDEMGRAMKWCRLGWDIIGI